MSVLGTVIRREDFDLSTRWKHDRLFVPIPAEKIIGLNNLMTYSWLQQAMSIGACVVRIVLKDGSMGTGSMIAPDLVLTNNHVISAEKEVEGAFVEFNYQRGWDGKQLPSRRFRLKSSRFKTSKALDYTICEVEGAPGSLYGYLDLSTARSPHVNDYVTIIQHPLGEYKQIALTDNKVSAVFDNNVQYTTDTQPGSSGSPVFDQNWQLVALHHMGGHLPGPDGSTTFINQGVNIMKVLSDARSFLGLPDRMQELVFGGMQNHLVSFLELPDPMDHIRNLGMSLMSGFPDFESAINDTQLLLTGLPQESQSQELLPLAAAIVGVASGAGIAHLANVSEKTDVLKTNPQESSPPFSIHGLVPVVSAAVENSKTRQPREIFGILSTVGGVIGAVTSVASVFESTDQQNEFLGAVLGVITAVQTISNLVEAQPPSEFLNVITDAVKIVDSVTRLFETQESCEVLPVAVAAFLGGVYAGAKAYQAGKD